MAPHVTRRTLLAHAGAGALALALPGRVAGVAPADTPPAKLISLGGPTALTPGSVNDYRFWGNREDVLATGTAWIKLWVAWAQLQGPYPPPGGAAESWDQLNSGLPGSGGLGLRVIDEQVSAANRDGVRVMLCLQNDAPAWATRLPGDPLIAPPGRHNETQRLPRERGIDSPFGWFVGHLCARYRRGVPANLAGPRPGVALAAGLRAGFGNPSGAFVDAIEIGNEPNLLSWPQAEAPRATAQMIRTADEWSARLGGPLVLGPATSDTDGRASETSHYLDFTRAVLRELGDWRPSGRVGWSHHNYGDMEDGTTARLRRVRDALEEAGWHDRGIWLTEGGYDATPHGEPQNSVPASAKGRQARVIERGWRAVRGLSAEAERDDRIGVVRTFAQHVVHDQDSESNTFKSGLRDDFRFEPSTPGARRPAWFAWRDLG